MAVHWKQEINFTSALLLHSCLTVLLKELVNLATLIHRWLLRRRGTNGARSSLTLDAYTSVICADVDGALSEMYFTNTGLGLLAMTLVSSVAMNLFLSSLVLNVFVTSTFGFIWIVSILMRPFRPVRVITSLRRAGRFVWSDTPFVNFFTLIYIATVLGGESNLMLRDYVIFRAISILELVFIKGLIAASNPDEQQGMMRIAIASETVVLKANVSLDSIEDDGGVLERDSIIAFTTLQRMSVMLFKTRPGYHLGSVRGAAGPLYMPVPEVGGYIDMTPYGWRVHRLKENVMLIADNLQARPASTPWARFIAHAHGVLLRRLGKVRVVYMLREPSDKGVFVWRSNANLVTGVSRRILDKMVEGEAKENQLMI